MIKKFGMFLLVLAMCTVSGQAQSRRLAHDNPNRAQSASSGVAPGYYFQLHTCHACAYNDWQKSTIAFFQAQGYQAFLGVGDDKTETEQKSAMVKSIKRTKFDGWDVPVYVGPFESEVSVMQALEHFPPILTRMIEKRGEPSYGSKRSERVRHESGNSYSFDDSFFFILGYRLQGALNTLTNTVGVSGDAQWTSFQKAFRDAVQKRDRRTLKGMMSMSFQFSSEDMSPDQAFTFLDAQRGKAWISLNGVVAKGAVPYKSPSSSRPSRIAPPIAAKNPNYDSWRAIFELGKDGRWRWVAFVIGD